MTKDLMKSQGWSPLERGQCFHKNPEGASSRPAWSLPRGCSVTDAQAERTPTVPVPPAKLSSVPFSHPALVSCLHSLKRVRFAAALLSVGQ